MDDDGVGLRTLLDHHEITGCLQRYVRGIDRCDTEVAVSCFHPDAVQDTGIYVGSPRGWAEMVNAFHLGRCVSQQHHLTNHVVDLDGDVAHVESYYWATVRENAGTTKLVSGRWIDRFERRDGEWLFFNDTATTETILDVAMADMAVADRTNVPFARDRTDLSYERPLRPVRGSASEPYRPLG